MLWMPYHMEQWLFFLKLASICSLYFVSIVLMPMFSPSYRTRCLLTAMLNPWSEVTIWQWHWNRVFGWGLFSTASSLSYRCRAQCLGIQGYPTWWPQNSPDRIAWPPQSCAGLTCTVAQTCRWWARNLLSGTGKGGPSVRGRGKGRSFRLQECWCKPDLVFCFPCFNVQTF